MGWLGNLLFGAAVGTSGVKAAMETAQNKRSPMKLPNGVPYYYDHSGRTYLMDGTQIFCSANDAVTMSGRVVWSRKESMNDYAKAHVSKTGKYRYAVQVHPRADNPLTVDLNTGKGIARVEANTLKDGRVEYRKWYFYDLYAEEVYPGEDLTWVMKVAPNSIKRGDPGIVITKEEFDAINNCPGINRCNSRYHDCFINGDRRYF